MPAVVMWAERNSKSKPCYFCCHYPLSYRVVRTARSTATIHTSVPKHPSPAYFWIVTMMLTARCLFFYHNHAPLPLVSTRPSACGSTDQKLLQICVQLQGALCRWPKTHKVVTKIYVQAVSPTSSKCLTFFLVFVLYFLCFSQRCAQRKPRRVTSKRALMARKSSSGLGRPWTASKRWGFWETCSGFAEGKSIERKGRIMASCARTDELGK